VPPFYFADGRDFCSFIEEKWSCQTTLFKLIQAIPQKLDKYFNINNDQTIMGKFHLGRLFDIDVFVGIPLCGILPNQKYIRPKTSAKHPKRM
jgi:hypothetical protein